MKNQTKKKEKRKGKKVDETNKFVCTSSIVTKHEIFIMKKKKT